MATFFDLDLSGVEPPEKNFEMPRKKGDVELVDLGSIINWVMTGQLLAYTNNRGNGKVSPATSKSCREGVKADAIGECTLGMWEDEDGDQRPHLNNFHSRLHGFLTRYFAGEMTKSELATKVSTRVVTDFIGSYQKLNEAPGHRNKDKICNPQLAFGDVPRVLEQMEKDCINAIGQNRWTIFSTVFFCVAYPKRSDSWYWPSVYQTRGDAKEIINERYGYMKITKEKKVLLEKAIQFWYNLILTLEAEAKNTNVKKIRSCAGFFGYVLCDRMSDNPRISENHRVTAKKILKNLNKVHELMPELCRGNKIVVMKYTELLDKCIKRKENEEVFDAAA